jgi:hypothetical protein
MKKIIYLFGLACFIASCNTQTDSASTTTNAADSAITAVGADADNHGCKGSAGYTYSTLLQDCIRTWEIGIMLNPITTKQEDVNIISVIFNKENTKAELFILDVKGTQILDKTAEDSYSNAIYQLNKKGGKWQLSKNNVLINKE